MMQMACRSRVRVNPLRGDWVLVSPRRNARPSLSDILKRRFERSGVHYRD